MPDATIYDVATHANVSIATVSRVLNTPHRVNQTTRKRVLAAIDDLGFVPKAEATARARQNHGRIGVLAPFFTFPSFMQRLRGISGALSGSAYELVIYSIDSAEQYRHYLETLPIVRRIDGLIIMSLNIDDASIERLLRHKLHTVLIETNHPRFSCIEIDSVAGGRIAAEFLLERGHHAVGFLGVENEIGDYTLSIMAKRLLGFREVITARGAILHEMYVENMPHNIETGYQKTIELLALPNPPTAIFAASDLVAMGVIKALNDRGLKIPEDMSVLGFDDLDMSEYIGLTTIQQGLDESGRIAVELLLARMSEPTRPVQHVRIPLTVIERQTV